MPKLIKELARALEPLIRCDGRIKDAAQLAARMLPGMRIKADVGGFGQSDLVGSYVDYINGIFITALEHAGGVFQRIREIAPKGQYHDRLFIPTSSPGGTIVTEGVAVPVSSYALSGSTLTPVKAAAIAVGSKESLRNPEGYEWLAKELTENTTLAVDTRIIARLRAACTPTEATADPVTDLATLAAAVITTGFSEPLLIAHPDVARILTFWRGDGDLLLFPDMTVLGGQIAGIPVAVSAGQVSDELTLVDAGGLVTAAGKLEISTSENAMIEMSDAPTGDTRTPTGATTKYISAFQCEAVAIKSVLDFALTELRSTAVACIHNIAWEAGS